MFTSQLAECAKEPILGGGNGSFYQKQVLVWLLSSSLFKYLHCWLTLSGHDGGMEAQVDVLPGNHRIEQDVCDAGTYGVQKRD